MIESNYEKRTECVRMRERPCYWSVGFVAGCWSISDLNQ